MIQNYRRSDSKSDKLHALNKNTKKKTKEKNKRTHDIEEKAKTLTFLRPSKNVGSDGEDSVEQNSWIKDKKMNGFYFFPL